MRGGFKLTGGRGWTMAVLRGDGADGGGGVTEGIRLRTALYTMKLSPQNSFGELHS